jgi:glycosyltransferase involved in cell wall biosynthesis
VKIGIGIEETWDFFHEIHDELCDHHDVTLFKRRTIKSPIFYERVNAYVFKRALRKLLTQNEVVFFEWASELLVSASWFPKTCGIVTRLHRYELYRWVDHVNWDNVDKVILVSEAKRHEFIERFPDYAGKAVVINEAISLSKFSFRPKEYRGDLGILCHLTPRKRIYELILDFYELTKKNKAFHLHIGGDADPSYGDYMDAMRHLVKDLALEDQVTFYGAVSDTGAWYHNIDIFISNSYSEGLQVALLEAMASGCFSLSHHWAGADEQLPPQNLFYSGHELQNKLLEFDGIPEDEKLRLNMQMREIVEKRNDVNHTKKQICRLIEEAGGRTTL